MGFRFQRRVRVFPGVRLNFSRTGISASLGVPGASVTVGPRGSHVSLGIAGTGLSYQVPTAHIAPPQSHATPLHPLPTPPELRPPVAGLPQQALTEIKSAPTNQLTSFSLKGLRDLLSEAYQESQRLKSEIPQADRELYVTQTRAYKWDHGYILKRLLKKKYQIIMEEFASTQAERKALDKEIAKCTIALEIEMEGGIDTTYGAMIEAFRGLAACERCWENVAARSVDQFHERSHASRAIDRRAVTLDLKAADVIAPSRSALRFQNVNGGDLYILPGMLIVLGSERDFALVRLTEVRLQHEILTFQETEGVPADTKVLGETWAKVNKDGSPDRRFANNLRIPIVEYGRLVFMSAAGLNQEFMFSSEPKAKVFAAAFAAHRAELPVS
jgi:hypothetical protein